MKKKKCLARSHRVFDSTLVLGILSILLFVCLPANLYAQPIPAVPVIGEDKVANICYTENDGITGFVKCKKFSLAHNIILEEKTLESFPSLGATKTHLQTTKSGAVVYLFDESSTSSVLKYVHKNGDVRELYRGRRGTYFIDVTTIDGVDYIALLFTSNGIGIRPPQSRINIYQIDEQADQIRVWNNVVTLISGLFIEIDGLSSNSIHLAFSHISPNSSGLNQDLEHILVDFDNQAVLRSFKTVARNFSPSNVTILGSINNNKPVALKVSVSNEPHFIFALNGPSYFDSTYVYSKLDRLGVLSVFGTFERTTYGDFDFIEHVVPIIFMGMYQPGTGPTEVNSVLSITSSMGGLNLQLLGIPALGSDRYSLLSTIAEPNGQMPIIASASIKNYSQIVLFELEEQGFKEHVLGPIIINNDSQISASFID